jgi:DNA-binding PadR family transcriptional regulator
MYLHILILAELTAGPAHGYELRRRIRKTLGGSVDINSNTIYPALKRFQADGSLVEYEDQQTGYPARYVYQLTEAGRRKLHEMLTDFGPALAQNDKEFLTRVAFFGLLSKEERQDILDIRAKALDARASYLDDLEHEVNDLRSSNQSGAFSSGNSAWQRSVLAYCRSQLMAESNWLNDLRDISTDATSEKSGPS